MKGNNTNDNMPEAGNEIDPELKVKGIAYEGHTI